MKYKNKYLNLKKNTNNNINILTGGNLNFIKEFSIDNTITNPEEISVLGIQGLSNGNIVVVYSKNEVGRYFKNGNGIVKIVDSEFNIIKEFTPECEGDGISLLEPYHIKNETKIFELENGNLAFYGGYDYNRYIKLDIS